MAQNRVGFDRRQHWERVGKSGAFDDDAAERRDQPALPLRVQILDRIGKLAAHRAAETARLQEHHGVVDALDQVMVEADLAELVDEDSGVGKGWVGKQARQQRRLTGAEEAREQIDRGQERDLRLSHRSRPPQRQSGRDRAGRRGGRKAVRPPARDGRDPR
ncbi:hypothetical protein D9M72_543090 [compost metagenome]